VRRHQVHHDPASGAPGAQLYRSNYRQRVDEPTPIPVAEVVAVGIKVAGALQVAHDQGVLNIFISHYGEPALGDFGISTLDDERSQSASSGLSLAYAAPEVLEDSPAARTSDIYALAASLYHLINGTSPFASSELRTTVKRILTEAPSPISRPDVPAGLSRVLLRTMGKDPAERPQSAHELAEMLREVQTRERFAPSPQAPGHGNGYADRRRGDGAGESLTPAARAPFDPKIGAVAPAAGAMPGAPPTSDQPDQPVPGEVGGTTIARPRTRPEAPPVEDEGPDRRRFWIGLGVAVVLVGAVVGVGLTMAGGEADPEVTTPATNPPVDQMLVVEPPAEIEVERANRRSFDVSFVAPLDAELVIVEVTNGPDAGRRIEVGVEDAGPARQTVRVESRDALCVELRATRSDGRISEPSAPACA
jgi:hypothetical protein